MKPRDYELMAVRPDGTTVLYLLSRHWHPSHTIAELMEWIEHGEQKVIPDEPAPEPRYVRPPELAQ